MTLTGAARLALPLLLAAACQTQNPFNGRGSRTETENQPRRPDLDGLDDLKLTVLDGTPAEDDFVAMNVRMTQGAGNQVGLALHATLEGVPTYYLGRIVARADGFDAEIIVVRGIVGELLQRMPVPDPNGTLSFSVRGTTLSLHLNDRMLATATSAALTGAGASAFTTKGAASATPFAAVAAAPEGTGRLRDLASPAARILTYERDDGTVDAVEVLEGSRRISARVTLKRGDRSGLYVGFLDARSGEDPSCVQRYAATLRTFADDVTLLSLAPDADTCRGRRAALTTLRQESR